MLIGIYSPFVFPYVPTPMYCVLVYIPIFSPYTPSLYLNIGWCAHIPFRGLGLLPPKA